MSDCLRLPYEKTYNDSNSVSFPSSFGSSPDKALMPRLLAIRTKIMIMNTKTKKKIHIMLGTNIITCME